jgi:hypothetical protein
MPDSAPKITVNVLCGKTAVDRFAAWRPDEERIPDEIGEAMRAYEFDSEREASAFLKGLQAGARWSEVRHLSPSQAEAIRRRLGTTSPQR